MMSTQSTPKDHFRYYTLPGGRRLAWHERGDPRGSVVFAFHGLPGSRLQVHPDEGIAYASGARIIHVDRPGFGLSDPMPGRRLADWAYDIRMLADHLCIDRFAVAGVSGGGPFACACAAQLQDRVSRAAIISGVGPRDSMLCSKSWAVRAGFIAAPSLRWLITPPVALAALVATHAPGFYLDVLCGRVPHCDREVLCRPEIRAMLLKDMPEAFRNGSAALLQDLQLEARPWGIAVERISCPVAFWHGSQDTVVPPRATERLAALLPHATVRIFPEAGHFFVFDVWPEIVHWLVGGRGS